MDIIDMNSYDAGYTSGLMEGINNGYEIGYNLCMKKVRIDREKERKRRLYFLKQKAAGVFLLLLTVLFAVALEGDITVAFFTVPAALFLIFTKEKALMNRYYYETQFEND